VDDGITLRPLKSTDGPGLTVLNEQTPDTGAVAFYTKYHYDPYQIFKALDPDALGVVAEARGHDGLVGMGIVSFGECTFEGQLRPYAYLSSLSVHPDFRRRGIASRLANWRVEAARARFGEEGVILAGIQTGNTGSLRTAETWSNQRLDGISRVGVVKMRAKPPRSDPGLEVREARREELEEIARKQNAFYADFNLYPPRTAGDFEAWLSRSAFGHSLHSYRIAVDREGNVLAGLGLTHEGELTTSHVLRMPAPLRLANLFLRIIPADGVNRRLKVDQLWFAPGRLDAGRFLWESIRWQCRDRGTMMMIFFDPRSPVLGALALPRLVPSTGGSIVLSAPVPAREEKFIYLVV
jgi:GNAT superfamily N-acetyltransferase